MQRMSQTQPNCKSAGITIKCQCTIFKNLLQINSKKKSKLSLISIDHENHSINIQSKADKQLYKFSIHKLKMAYKKFIEEGKLTLEFDSSLQGHSNSLLRDQHQDGNIRVFISNASKENLDILIKSIETIKKRVIEQQSKASNLTMSTRQPDCPDRRPACPTPSSASQNSKHNPHQTHKGLIIRGDNRKSQFISSVYSSMQPCRALISKKNLLKQIWHEEKPIQRLQRPLAKQVHRPRCWFDVLPKILYNMIFSYTGIQLNYRLICKQLDGYVLHNIRHIRLREEIETDTFNKLCKYAVNVRGGRMKNVRKLELIDRHDEQTLLRNRAKSLFFGSWKEIAAKNIQQLQGLRIYCLEIPYQIKFEFKHLLGLRLVELRLKGTTNIRNSLIKDQQIIYMINTINELQVIDVAYASTQVLKEIKNPPKMSVLKFGVLNVMDTPQNWTDLSKFSNLKEFRCGEMQRNGNRDIESIYDIKWPQKLYKAELGMNLTQQSRLDLPSSVSSLKLIGEYFRNHHLRDFYMPKLSLLDISETPYVTAECLQHLRDLRVVTDWGRVQVEQVMSYFGANGIQIASTKCYTPYN